MSLARKIKRQQMRKTKPADMKSVYDHADRVAACWDMKEKDLSEERTLYTFSATLAVCCKVLCRAFPKNFTKLNGKPRKNSRLARFCCAVAEEVSNIDTRTNEGLKRYMDAVYKEYGVRFDYASEGDK